MASNKISWIISLVSNHQHISCIHALADICLLIHYCKTLNSSLQKEMRNLKKSPENLRTFFFELFIYRALDINNIANSKKPIVGNQVLEGVFMVGNKEWLFECRKVFMPRIHELDIKTRLMRDIYKYAQTQQYGRGMICRISINKPMKGAHRSNLLEKIKRYFHALNADNKSFKIDYTDTDEFGTFTAVNYNDATLVEIKSRREYDILLVVIPPKIPVPGIPDYYAVKIDSNFSVDRSIVYEKLEIILKEKKEQHRNAPYTRKLLFLDNEIIPEFQWPLFQHESMYDPEKVRVVYKKLQLDFVVCILLRTYNDHGPYITADIIYPENYEEEISQIKQIVMNCFPKSTAV